MKKFVEKKRKEKKRLFEDIKYYAEKLINI